VPQSIDVPWALERLTWWILNAEEARRQDSLGHKMKFANASSVSQLREREHQTRQIIGVVLDKPIGALLQATTSTTNVVEVQAGIDLARYAQGILNTKEETASFIVGTPAPAMDADSLHSSVWDSAVGLWSDGHFAAAVQRAATQVNADVQFRVSRYDISDKDLMTQTFSLAAPEPGKPRLRWPGEDEDLTVRAMRVGLLSFSQGVFAAIRNAVTHSTKELPQQVAFEYLATLSTLTRWIDHCELVTD